MKARVFISYTQGDHSKANLIKKELSMSPLFDAVVIEDERNPNIPLNVLVKRGIESAFCIIPILSPHSINNQWVNQEIGFAEGSNIPIIPIVEISVLDRLKGFITKQNQCPYKYTARPIDQLKEENKDFKIAFRLLIYDLEKRYASLMQFKEYNKPLKKGVVV